MHCREFRDWHNHNRDRELDTEDCLSLHVRLRLPAGSHTPVIARQLQRHGTGGTLTQLLR